MKAVYRVWGDSTVYHKEPEYSAEFEEADYLLGCYPRYAQSSYLGCQWPPHDRRRLLARTLRGDRLFQIFCSPRVDPAEDHAGKFSGIAGRGAGR